MENYISLNSIVNFLAIIITVGGSITMIYKGIKALNGIHDKMESWDKNVKDIEKVKEETADSFAEMDAKIETAHEFATEKLEEIRRETNDKIEEMHTDTDAKLQELKAEQYMMVTVLQAVLDGLKQLNCNGSVTETKKKLDEYITQKAYEV